MKFNFAFAVLSLLSFFSFAQELNSSKTLQAALNESAKKNKPVLLIINTPSPVKLENMPAGVKVNFKSGLDDKEVIQKINENFVVYKTTLIDTSTRSIVRLTNIKFFPAYIFLRDSKEVFYTEFANSTDAKRYLSMVDKAFIAFKEKPIAALEKDYEADKTDIIAIKKLIDARKKIGIMNNADLIEQYAKNLKIGDFNNYENVLYILEAGPYADGTAYRLAYTNRKLTDSLYKTEPLQKRLAINRAIISNTMNAAAKAKNVNQAMVGANFERTTWSKDYREGNRSYNNQMLWYYLTVKDTASYIRTASYFYDDYYMIINADSIKKMEARKHQANIQAPFPQTADRKIVSKEKMDSLMKLPGYKVTQSMVTVTSSSVSYANELNNAAWKFYEIGTKNLKHLTKAMLWSRRAIELNPFSGYYDTLAHILYRMEFYEEALRTQEKAVEKAKAENKPTTSYEQELKKIKARTL